MRKKIYLLGILLITLLSAANGQYIVNFEGAGETKTAYASGTVTLSGLQWNMTEVLIGTEAADWKNGARSARLRGYGTSSMTMLNAKTDGVGIISFNYRRYGTDAQVDWKVEYSIDGAGPWTQVGSTFTSPANNDVQLFSETLNIPGTVYIRIKRATETGTSNRRLNIDDITLTDFVGGGNIPPSISNISISPAQVYSTDPVNVSATIVDSDGNIGSANLNWGLSSGNLTNVISMTLVRNGNYTTSQPIPQQIGGTTVYYQIAATDNQNATTTSQELSYTVSDPATQLAFVNLAANIQQGAALPLFTVEARNAGNTVDGNYSGAITLSKASGPGNISGTLSRNAINGIASFNNISFDAPGTYAITATADGLTSAQSTLITVTPGPALTEILLPQYIQGINGTNNDRIPFAYRVRIDNLNPNTTYRYINQVVIASDGPTINGAGNAIYVTNYGTFIRTTGPSFNTINNYGEFETDANGSFTGWFITEPTGNEKFTPGNEVYMRIRLNNGAGGTAAVTYLTTTNSVKVVNFGTVSGSPTQGTGLYSISNFTAKNFAVVYDNTQGTGRPVSGTFVENDNTSGGTSYASFYGTNVDGQDGRFGLILPNSLPEGIKLIQQRSLTNGSVVSSRTSFNGIWGDVSTINPAGGLNNPIVLDFLQQPNLNVQPDQLSGFNYSEGQGPSAVQSFIVSGSNLSDIVTIIPPSSFEISLSNTPSFVPVNTITISPSGGTVAPVTIFTRMKAGLTEGSYNNEIMYVTSTGTELKTVSLSGTVSPGIFEPINYPTAFTAQALTYNSIKVDWADAVPAANGYLIKGSSVGFADIISPVDGIAETNSLLVRNVAGGNQTYTFTGLEGSATYYFKIFPYNGTGNLINYKTSPEAPSVSTTTPAGPSMSDDVLPLTMQGLNGTNNNRVPYAFRATISNLSPNTTYRYINGAVSEGETGSGAGNPIYINAGGQYTRATGMSLSTAGQYGEFTTDGTGKYSGWFMLEPTGNARFTPGAVVFMRIRLNNGDNGTVFTHSFTSQAVTVLNFATAQNAASGTGIRANSNFNAGNLVFLYGQQGRSSRPIAGTQIEATGIDFAGLTSYPAFYRSNVAGINGAWGTIIPNMNPDGIRFIEERSLLSGAVVATRLSADGSWGNQNTVNPVGGLTQILVLDLDQTPSIFTNPAQLAGFEYTQGFGPSEIQSFTVSAQYLSNNVVINAPAAYEISLSAGALFSGSSSIQLLVNNGSLEATTVYVRLKANLLQNTYNQNITISSAGLANVNLALAGEVGGPVSAPEYHVSAFRGNANSMVQLSLFWNEATPPATAYLIKGSTVGFSSITPPVNGVTEPNSFLVRNIPSGTGQVVFADLNPETVFYFKIFPYNGTGAARQYKTDGFVPQVAVTTLGNISADFVLLPQFMQGESGTNNNRVPFAFRARINNLTPNSTFRYINQAVSMDDSPTTSGVGNPVFVNGNQFVRSTNPSLTTAGNYGSFTTDNNGSYEGWFMLESSGNTKFTPGNQIYMRIRLNDGQGGTQAVHYLTSPAVQLINFGTAAQNTEGTAIRAITDGGPKNFVFIYDNATGANRPLYGTSIETTGIDYASNTSYAGFYRNDVAGVNGSWGGIVPNINGNGIKRIEERFLGNGNIVGTRVSEDGYWGNINTVNPTGGLANIIVLDLTSSGQQETIAGQFKLFGSNETLVPSPNNQGAFYIQLFENGVAVRPRQLVRYNTVNGLSSYYEFSNLEAGRIYTLRVWEQTLSGNLSDTWTWNNWGGISSIDALLIHYMSVNSSDLGLFPWVLPAGANAYTAFADELADVNNSGNITGLDALTLMYRLIGEEGTNPFPGNKPNFALFGEKRSAFDEMLYPQAPDKKFALTGSYAANASSNSVYYELTLPALEAGVNIYNVYFAAAGDINISFDPTAVAPASGTLLNYLQTVPAQVGSIVELDIFANEKIDLASGQFSLTYNPQLIEIKELSGTEFYRIDPDNGSLHIGFLSPQGAKYEAGQPLVSVKAKINAPIAEGIRYMELDRNAEFIAPGAVEIPGLQLYMHPVATENATTPELSHKVYPNPSISDVKLQLLLPEAGLLSLKVYNPMGQLILSSNELVLDGNFEKLIQRNQLPGNGLYSYTLQLHGRAKVHQLSGKFMMME